MRWYNIAEKKPQGVGIVTKQNATKERIPFGGEYANVKKLEKKKKKKKEVDPKHTKKVHPGTRQMSKATWSHI